MTNKKYTIEVDDEMSRRLKVQATAANRTIEELIANCVSLHLDMSARLLLLLDRMDVVDQGLIDIASFVGDVAASVQQAHFPDTSSEQP